MDSNQIKKVEDLNLTDPEHLIIRTIDELNNQGKKLINKLNHDCLAKVLMHLPILERFEMEKVCQKWEEAVDLSWYTVRKIDWNDLMIPLDKKEEILEMLMIKCGRFLTHLTITDDQYPWMSSLLKENCQNITNFSIKIKKNNRDKYTISSDHLVEIIHSMKKLKYLKFEINGNESVNVIDRIVDELPEDIQEIHLIKTEDEPGHEFIQIAPVLERFTSLNCLTLHGFSLTNGTLNGILKNKSTLSTLDLSNCKYPSNGPSIFKNLNNLSHLTLYFVDNFNVNEITSVAHNCSKLKHFEFINAINFIPATEENMLPFNIYRELKYLNLEYLSIYKIDKSGYEGENLLAGMTNNWKQLKYLNLNKGHDFSPADFKELTKLNYLQFLDLQCAKVDTELFKNIANNCLELKEIGMSINKLSETALLELPKFKKFEKLFFYYNNHLTGNLLDKITINCENLVNLSILNCPNVTKESLIKVGRLKNLKNLDIQKIKNVPNEMFDYFCKLEYLSCHGCKSVTDVAIIKVLDNCKKLAELELQKTGITFKSLVHASKRKFVFKLLNVEVDEAVEDKFRKNCSSSSAYLRINGN